MFQLKFKWRLISKVLFARQCKALALKLILKIGLKGSVVVQMLMFKAVASKCIYFEDKVKEKSGIEWRAMYF